MNAELARLTEFENLFKNRWRPFVLWCLLDNGPMRFRQLTTAMQQRTGPTEHVPDSAITSAIKMLRRDGLVRSTTIDGELINALTTDGVRKAKRVQRIFTALDHYHGPEEAASKSA